MAERLDEERLEILRTWGAGLSTSGRDELRAAGKAIVMLVEEIDRLQADVWMAGEVASQRARVDTETATAVAPELQIIKQRYRAHFKAAFERAIDELSPRDRTLLKLHVIERSSIDDIGALYKVHRATAARWLEAIRDNLGERTRALLAAELALGPAELESVVRAVQSQVSVSLSRILD